MYIKIIYPLILVLGSSCALLAQMNCIDSVEINTISVQCNTFRNGSISIASVNGGTPPYYYSIDGTTFSTRPEFEFLWPGAYTVTIKDTLGCEYNEIAIVEEPPVLEVLLNTNKTLVAIGESFQLSATYYPTNAAITSVYWRPPDLFEDGNKYEQTVSRIKETTTFAIEIIDQNGCTARDQVTVEVKLPNIYAPNVISVGSNQDAYFTIFTDDYVEKIKTLNIYSRSGGLVFQRTNFPPNDPLLGWNGRVNNKKVQSDVFTWVAEVVDLDGNTQLLYGSLTVVR